MEIIKSFFIVVSTAILTTFAIYSIRSNKVECEEIDKQSLIECFEIGYWTGATTGALQAKSILELGADTVNIDVRFTRDSIAFSKIIN